MDEVDQDLMRLLSLIETYTAALEELGALEDPGVAALAAQLETLRAQAAVEAFGRHTPAEVDQARRAVAAH